MTRMPYKERLGDRRGDLRFEIIGQLWGSLDAVELLPLRNLGTGGALVESRLPLKLEAVHAVRLMFEEKVNQLQVRVRHVTPMESTDGERYLVGFEFIDPGASALEQIDRIVAAGLCDPAARSEA
jgi:hypothetical protein